MARQVLETLGVWADDPRSVQGAMAIDSMQTTAPRERTNGHFRDSLVPDLDPRVVATKAEQAYRQSPLGHTETVVMSTRVRVDMTRGQEYSMR